MSVIWAADAFEHKVDYRTVSAPLPFYGMAIPTIQAEPEHPGIAFRASRLGRFFSAVRINLHGSVANIRLFDGHLNPTLSSFGCIRVGRWLGDNGT